MSSTPYQPAGQLAVGAPPPAVAGPTDPFAARSGGGGGVEIGDVIRILKRRKLTIAIVAALVYTLVAAGTIVAYLQFPLYRAAAQLQMLPPKESPYQINEQLADPKHVEFALNSEAQRLKQLSLLQSVLRLPEVKETQYFRGFEGNFEKALYQLQDDLSVGPVRETELINVAFAAREPAEARLIVDSVINRYLSTTQSESTDAARGQLGQMRDNLTDLIADLEQKRREIRDYRQQANAMQSEVGMVQMLLVDLYRERSLLDSEAIEYRTQLEAIAGRPAEELPITPEMRIRVEADPIVRFRSEQVENLSIQRDALLNAGVFGKNHEQMQLLKAQIEGFRLAEIARTEQLYDDMRQQQLDMLEQGLERTRALLNRLNEQIREEEARQRDLDAAIVRYEEMVADRDRLEAEIARVEAQIRDAEQTTEDPRMLQRFARRGEAQTPPRPTWPNLPLFLGGGLFLALGCGVGLAFLREFADQAVRTPVDVARHAHLSVLGTIPELDDDEADLDHIEQAALDAPRSLVAEAFRQVRTNLMFSGPEEVQRVVLVTSPGAGDGKSAVAQNLAITFAQAGQRVLLVDCNFRRPTVRRAFNNTRAEGLSNLLINQVQLDEAITATDIPNLDVITSGPLPPTPAELLGTPAMRAFLEEVARRYDRVVLDGPPVLLMSDAHVLAVQVSSVVFVTRAAANTKGALRRANEQLQRIGARIVGAVLNGVEARAGGYFRRQYREFYEYTSDETLPAELPGDSDMPPTPRDQT